MEIFSPKSLCHERPQRTALLYAVHTSHTKTKMAITRSRQQVKPSRTAANSRRAAATCLKLQRRERREGLKKARELTGRRLLLYLPLENPQHDLLPSLAGPARPERVPLPLRARGEGLGLLRLVRELDALAAEHQWVPKAADLPVVALWLQLGLNLAEDTRFLSELELDINQNQSEDQFFDTGAFYLACV
jgi:hypothetical protein